MNRTKELTETEDRNIDFGQNSERSTAHITESSSDNDTSQKKEMSHYDSLSKEELLTELKRLIENQSPTDIKFEVEAIHKLFTAKTNKRVKSDGNEESPTIPDSQTETDKTFYLAMQQYRTQRDLERQQQEEEKEKNLEAKQSVIEEIKALLDKQESINETFNEFKALQQKWKEIGPVPPSKNQDIWENYHHHVENFYNYIKINKELRDLDLKKNYEIKEELCKKAEALCDEESPIKAFKTLQKYHDEWRETGPVIASKKEELWERFKAATAIINQKQQEHFEALKNQLQKNLKDKEALCEKAEELLNSQSQTPRDWEKLSKELIDLQQIWKTIGFAPKKENNLIYERFRKACDQFFNQKREFFKTYKNEQQDNLKLKIELCEQAEAMKESSDWKKSTDDFINIQKKWKKIGPVPRKQSDAVWKRFREACDHFFNRKNEFFNKADSQQEENLTLKQQLIKELNDFNANDDSENCFEKLQSFQKKWNEIGFVPIKEKEAINQEFRNLINQKFDQLNLDEINKNTQKFRNKLENWKTNNLFDEKIGSERNKIALKLKQLENDIIVWENNIGFFAKSKKSEGLIREFQNKIENGKRNIKLLNQKLQMIEEML